MIFHIFIYIMCFVSVGNRMKAIVIKASYENAPLSFSADISKNHFRKNLHQHRSRMPAVILIFCFLKIIQPTVVKHYCPS